MNVNNYTELNNHTDTDLWSRSHCKTQSNHDILQIMGHYDLILD